MVGVSRKSTIKKSAMIVGSSLAAHFAIKNGAKILRVHDVKQFRQKVWGHSKDLVEW